MLRRFFGSGKHETSPQGEWVPQNMLYLLRDLQGVCSTLQVRRYQEESRNFSL